jgi:hypothetical protein
MDISQSCQTLLRVPPHTFTNRALFLSVSYPQDRGLRRWDRNIRTLHYGYSLKIAGREAHDRARGGCYNKDISLILCMHPST